MVVGDGIVGLACALRLVRAGVATTVIGPATNMASASWGNAGHLAVEQAEPFASARSVRKAAANLFVRSGAIRMPIGEIRHWLPFFLLLSRASRDVRFRAGTRALTSCMLQAAPAWRAMLEHMDRPELLVERGHFVVWETPATARRGKAHWQSAATGPASCRDATAEELAGLEALVKKQLPGALRFAGTGQFTDPGELLETLESSIAAGGGSRFVGSVTKIVRDNRGRAMLQTEQGVTFEADAIVIAAGIASGRLLASTGLTAPIIAERGYHIQAPAGRWPAGLPPVVFEDRAMIVSNFTSGLRASGFVEFAGADRAPDASRWQVLERHVSSLNLPFGEPLSCWMGARPTFPDYLPAIGKSPLMRNLYYAFGHQHLGVTLAALTADLLTDLIAGRSPAVDLQPFDITRFGRAAK